MYVVPANCFQIGKEWYSAEVSLLFMTDQDSELKPNVVHTGFRRFVVLAFKPLRDNLKSEASFFCA